jgi:hypothetical protein
LANISRSSQPDHLLKALQQCDRQLEAWLSRSPANARLMAQNPAAAIRAARLNLSRETMFEFFEVLLTLAEKLELSLPEPAGTA